MSERTLSFLFFFSLLVGAALLVSLLVLVTWTWGWQGLVALAVLFGLGLLFSLIRDVILH